MHAPLCPCPPRALQIYGYDGFNIKDIACCFFAHKDNLEQLKILGNTMPKPNRIALYSDEQKKVAHALSCKKYYEKQEHKLKSK